MGRPRPRQAADDDWSLYSFLQDLRVAADEVLNEEPVLQQSEQEHMLLHDAGSVEPSFVGHGAAEDTQSVDELLGAEVVESRFGTRRRHELGRIEG